jgi:hypothetical protein
VISIPVEIIGFFNSPNPSSHTMSLGWTLPLREMSTTNLPSGKGRPTRKADNITAMCEQIVYKMWQPRRLTTLSASTAYYRDNFIFYLLPLSEKCSHGNAHGHYGLPQCKPIV